MTATFETTTFDRVDKSTLGPGKTTEFKDELGHTLAYIDYDEYEEQASCVVFDPTTSKRREYRLRGVEQAEGIVERHIAKLGYVEREYTAEERAERAQQSAARVAQKHGELAIGIDGDTVVIAENTVNGYAVISDDELQDSLDKIVDAADAPITEAGSVSPAEITAAALSTLDADIDAHNERAAQLPEFCPRCGINTLNHERPALNARSRFAPLYICSPCGTHEALTPGGIDLWHDKIAPIEALRARYEKQQDTARARALNNLVGEQ